MDRFILRLGFVLWALTGAVVLPVYAQNDPPKQEQTKEEKEAQEKQADQEAKEKIKLFQEELRKSLRTQDEDVLIEALAQLGRTQHPRIFGEITKYLAYGDKNNGKSVRREAARQIALYEKDARAALTLLDAVKRAPEIDSAVTFVECAGSVKSRDAAKRFIALFNEHRVDVSVAAISACGKIKSKMTIQPLINLLLEMDRIPEAQNASGVGAPQVPGGSQGQQDEERDRAERKKKVMDAVTVALKEITGWGFDRPRDWEKEWRKKGAEWKEPEI